MGVNDRVSGAPRCVFCGRNEHPEACEPQHEVERCLFALSKSDPDVQAAEQRYREATSEYEVWRRNMVREVWGA